jgi:hypothetical protein
MIFLYQIKMNNQKFNAKQIKISDYFLKFFGLL